MPMLASLALAATLSQPTDCAWKPGESQAYTGDVVAALDSYKDIPAAVRAVLKERMERRAFDDIVRISRDAVQGRQDYQASLSGMHFEQTVCAQVTRDQWGTQDVALGLSYCEGNHCVVVPTSGRNVARLQPLNSTTMAEALVELENNPPAAGRSPYPWATGRILVEGRAGLSPQEMGKILAVHGGKGRKIGASNMYVVNLPNSVSELGVAAFLSRHPQLKFAQLDHRLEPTLVPNDPYFGSQWHLNKIGADPAWDVSQGTGVTIAILDSGVDASHPDLAANMVPGWNTYDGNADTNDVFGHGTKVAGAAAAASNNTAGVAGVAGRAKIMPIRVTDTSGYGYSSTIAEGLTWAADNGARVANVSFEVAGLSAVISAANYMRSKGGLVVVSAGNSGSASSAAATTALTVVSATDGNDSRTSWSTYGPAVTLAAPGAGIWTTTKGGGYAAVSGTSFAAPVTAGVIGLMMAAKPGISNSQVETLLYSSAVDLGASGRDNEYGHGRVNALAAVRAAQASTVAAADTQAPVATISSPGASSTVSGVVAVNVAASDNVGVAKVEFRVNGALIGTDTTAPYGFSWDTSQLANGMSNLVATAFDTSGNVGTSASVAVNVANSTATPAPTVADTSAPAVTISNPVAGMKVSGSVTIRVAATDNMGSSGIRHTLRINGVTVATGSGSSLSYSWNTRRIQSGSHTIQAVARDAAGNSATSTVQVTK